MGGIGLAARVRGSGIEQSPSNSVCTNITHRVAVIEEILLITVFEPRTSGVESNHSAN